MTAYPDGNPGAFPIDYTTPVGVFRALVGDTLSEPYDPAEAGFQNFEQFSDGEITGYLAAGGDSLNRAAGYAYLALAGKAAKTAESVKDFDLSLDDTKRPTELRLIAESWFAKADKETAAAQDAFEVAPLGDICERLPEGLMPQWGRVAVPRWGQC